MQCDPSLWQSHLVCHSVGSPTQIAYCSQENHWMFKALIIFIMEYPSFKLTGQHPIQVSCLWFEFGISIDFTLFYMHCSCIFFSTKYESLSKNCHETFEAVHCIYCRCCKQIKLIVNWMWWLRLVLSFCLNVRQMKLICKISGYVWEIISANMYMYLSWNYC